MIIQCPACLRLVDVTTFCRDGDRVGVQCTQCHVVEWLGEGAADAPPAKAPAPSIHPVPSASPPATASAPSIQWSPKLIDAVGNLGDTETERVLLTEFTALLERGWEDDDAHKKLTQRAQLGDNLALLGRAYRTVRESHADDAMALKAQDRIVTLAMSTLAPLATSPRESASSSMAVKVVMVIVGVVIMGVAGVYIARTLTDLSAQ